MPYQNKIKINIQDKQKLLKSLIKRYKLTKKMLNS